MVPRGPGEKSQPLKRLVANISLDKAMLKKAIPTRRAFAADSTGPVLCCYTKRHY
jgi:hypothetical protein